MTNHLLSINSIMLACLRNIFHLLLSRLKTVCCFNILVETVIAFKDSLINRNFKQMHRLFEIQILVTFQIYLLWLLVTLCIFAEQNYFIYYEYYVFLFTLLITGRQTFETILYTCVGYISTKIFILNKKA